LLEWLMGQLTRQPSFPFDDVRRITEGILDIAICYQEDGLLTKFRESLTGDRRPLAVSALTTAALDTRFGTEARRTLYNWVTTESPDQSTIDLVAEVCGGQFGESKPAMALVRLGHAAQRSPQVSQALINAYSSIAAIYPEAVLKSIAKGFTNSDSSLDEIKPFLALASTESGAKLLCDQAGPGNYDSNSATILIDYFSKAITNPGSHDDAYHVLDLWEGFASAGTLNEETVVRVLGGALAPQAKANVIWRFSPPGTDLGSIRGRVLVAAFEASAAGKFRVSD
jgi:hypothetical protein